MADNTMTKSSDWMQDSLTFVGSFLKDSEPIDVDALDLDDASSTGLSPKLDQRMPVDDDSLFSYLSGEYLDDAPDEANKTRLTMNDGVIFVRPSNGVPQAKRNDDGVIIVRPSNGIPQANRNGGEVCSNAFTEPEAIFVVTKSPPLQVSNSGTGSNSNSRSRSSQSGCKSKDAINARERRLRYKQYVSRLEASLKELTEENQQLKAERTEQDNHVKKLKEEVRYLKSVTANKSALSALLKNICNSGCANLTDLTAGCGTDTITEEDAVHPCVSGEKRKLPSPDMDMSNSAVNSSEDITSKDVPSAPTAKTQDAVVPKESQELGKLTGSGETRHTRVKRKKNPRGLKYHFI